VYDGTGRREWKFLKGGEIGRNVRRDRMGSDKIKVAKKGQVKGTPSARSGRNKEAEGNDSVEIEHSNNNGGGSKRNRLNSPTERGV